MYAKIRLYNEIKSTIISTAVPTWGANESEITENIKKMVQTWADVTSFSIIRTSPNPILIEKFFVEIQVIYRNHSSRIVKLNLLAETEEEAEEIAKEIVSGWDHVVHYRIKSSGLQH